MYQNYQKRVIDFITEMTIPSHQIKYKDVSEKVNNTRELTLKQSRITKPFVFKGYISEADRIKDTIKKNKYLYNLFGSSYSKRDHSYKNEIDLKEFYLSEPQEKIKIPELSKSIVKITTDTNDASMPGKKLTIAEKRQYNDLLKKKAICQPQMRYRARTDLERVYDALTGKDNKDNEIIERQLTKIDLYNYKRPEEVLNIKKKKADKSKEEEDLKRGYKILANPFVEELKKKQQNLLKETSLYMSSNLYYEPKNNDKKLWARKDNLNNEARHLLSEYHHKTHFKAAEEIAENENKNINQINSRTSCFLLPNLHPKNYSPKNIHNNELGEFNSHIKNLTVSTKKQVRKLRNRKTFNFDDEEYNDNINNNNPIIEKFRENPNKETMQLLTQLAFKTQNNEDDYDFEEEENILNKDKNKIKESEYSKINEVAKKILKECNFYMKKSKYNNTSLKKNKKLNLIQKLNNDI